MIKRFAFFKLQKEPTWVSLYMGEKDNRHDLNLTMLMRGLSFLNAKVKIKVTMPRILI